MNDFNEIDRLFSEIVGESGFVFADPVEPEVVGIPEGVQLIFATVKYSGDVNGWMSFLIDKALTVEFVKNMLGLENTPVSSEIVKDAVEEFSNIFCGHFIKLYYGDNLNYRIVKDSVGLTGFDFLQKDDGRDCRFYLADDHYLALCFRDISHN